MALQQKLSQRLSQRLVMTPALQMAIKLLQLNKLELEQTLQQELVENPVLEDRAEAGVETEVQREEANGVEVAAEQPAESTETSPEDQIVDNLDTDAFFEKFFDYQPTTPNMSEEREGPTFEATLTSTPGLIDHLSWQLEMTELACDEEIVEAVLGNLDESGYMRASVGEVAAMGTWPPLDVERAVAAVQELDPAGVGARDLRECLFLQLERLGLADGLVVAMVRDHLDSVKAHRYKEIARALHVRLTEVADAMEVVRALNPKPGQQYSDESPRYITPDVHVKQDGDSWVVAVNDDGLPKLRVSRLYRKMLDPDSGISPEAAEYLQDKLRSALWLIKSFGQRQRTIGKVAESIVEHQQAFMEHGLAALRPMVLRDVADDIEMHESTVSRVVNGKYMHTPQGIFEMRFFFHSGLGHASGADVSSVSVKEKIRKLIDSEDSRRPLSDAAVAKRLKEGGLQIARRTVAKYREEMHIPASKARRRIG
ncbi:MAG: RNA polymerase factor sigma-54 [Acidobacteria bacterium]|nr:RNA polymerase factor sigma-54 [Acidobacteriota bacterium]